MVTATKSRTDRRHALSTVDCAISELRQVKNSIEQNAACSEIFPRTEQILHLLHSLEEELFSEHFETSLVAVFCAKSRKQAEKQISELVGIFKRFRFP